MNDVSSKDPSRKSLNVDARKVLDSALQTFLENPTSTTRCEVTEALDFYLAAITYSGDTK